MAAISHSITIFNHGLKPFINTCVSCSILVLPIKVLFQLTPLVRYQLCDLINLVLSNKGKFIVSDTSNDTE